MRLPTWRLLAVGVLAVLAASAALAATGPALRVARERPLVLTGVRFKPHEAVRVTVRTGSRILARQTHAGPRGGFSVEFRGVKVNFCSTSLSIVARGTSSGTVRARLPRRSCPSLYEP
jgi:hypothetical protein